MAITVKMTGVIRFSVLTSDYYARRFPAQEDAAAHLFSPERMELRFRMFEKLCLPSLVRQSDADFRFVVLTSDRMPGDCLRRLEDLLRPLQNSRLVAAPPGVHYQLLKQAYEMMPEEGESHFIRFRLDDDDAVDMDFVRRTKAIAQTKILNEEVTLRATIEGGVLSWRGNNFSRSLDRYVTNPDIIRGFEPGGIGPRDMTLDASGAPYDDALGGNLFAVARLEAEFPLGLPEEIGLRGGVFLDIGNLWDLDNVDTAGATIVGADGSWRSSIGLSFLWDTAFGPLRFNFSKALQKETFDKEQSFDLTIQAKF